MFCIYCGTNNPDDAIFCRSCGKQQHALAKTEAANAPGLVGSPSEASTEARLPLEDQIPRTQGPSSILARPSDKSSSSAPSVSSPLEQVQCPDCGRYNPSSWITYKDPRTGKHKSANGPHGCLIWIPSYFAISIIIVLLTSWWLPYGIYDPLTIVAGIVGAFLAIPVNRAYRRSRLRRTHITVEHFVCKNCEKEWSVEYDPIPVQQ